MKNARPIAVCMLVILGSIPHRTDAKDPEIKAIKVGDKVPDFQVVNLEGKKLSLKDLQKNAKEHKQNAIVLTFWCSFCHSCRHIEKDLEKLHKKYGKHAAVYALDASYGEEAEDVKKFAKKHELTLPILLNDAGTTADLFGTKLTTTTVVIDSKGILRYCGVFSTRDHRLAEDALKSVLANEEVKIKTTRHRG